VYERLYQKRREGYDVFAPLMLYGQIVCSSVFPSGHILVLKRVEGQPLYHAWDGLNNNDKTRVLDQCRKAVQLLRSAAVWVSDAGKHNVLYSKETNRVTMIDFESIGECVTPQELSSLDPELLGIFGPVVSREPIVGGG
jgi:RIO-like serine/threonine protein kinase